LSEVWFTTRSTITRMPRSRAVRTNSTKSPWVPELGVDAVEVGDVVAVVAVRGRVEGHQPQAGDPELGEVVDAFGQSDEVPVPSPSQSMNVWTSRQ
jgi:hypothetical protein